jgi:drug/metabolite transporter (DMT)-like permease
MNQTQNNKLALTAIIIAAVFGGGISVFSKIGLREIPPVTLTFLRFLMVTVFLFPLVAKEKALYTKSIGKVFFVSVLATVNVTAFAFGVKLTTATIGQLLYVFVPIITAIFSYFLLKEKMTTQKIVGVLLGLAGVVLIIVLPVFSKGGAFQGNILGDLIVLVGVTSFAIYSVFSKKYQQQLNISPLLLTFMFGLTTVIVLSVFALHEYISNPGWVHHVTFSGISSALYVGIFGGAIYYSIYQYAIKHGTPLIASMTQFLQPVATFGWAFTLIGEKLTIGIFIGGVMAFAGAYIVTIKKLPKLSQVIRSWHLLLSRE